MYKPTSASYRRSGKSKRKIACWQAQTSYIEASQQAAKQSQPKQLDMFDELCMLAEPRASAMLGKMPKAS